MIKLLRAMVTVVKDPDRTDAVFTVITNPLITNQQTFHVVLNHMVADSRTKELIDSRHLGEWKLDDLKRLPANSFGHLYATHMLDNNLDPDFFPKLDSVQTHSYLQMRSRQTHDIWHVLTGFTTSIADEAGLQAFTFAQMRSPSSVVIISLFALHAAIFKPSILVDVMDAVTRGWMDGKKAKPLFAERFEDVWDMDMNAYRKQLGLPPHNA